MKNQKSYGLDTGFFTKTEMMEVPETADKYKVLHLPKEVVAEIYYKNAEKWFLQLKRN